MTNVAVLDPTAAQQIVTDAEAARDAAAASLAQVSYIAYETPHNSTAPLTAVSAPALDVSVKAPGRAGLRVTETPLVSVAPIAMTDGTGINFGGGTTGNDNQVWAYRPTGGTGIWARPTVLQRVEILWPGGTNGPSPAPSGATVQLFHLRTQDSGATYELVDYIGTFNAEVSAAVGVLQIAGLNVLMQPDDVIGMRSLGRQHRSFTANNAATLGYERLRFGNTSTTAIDAIFTEIGTAITPTAVNAGNGPAMNFYGVEQTGVNARDVAGGVPSLDANARVKGLSAPWVDGLVGKKVVIVGTSITDGAGARTDPQGAGFAWAELLAQHTGADVVNRGQGSSQITFPKAGQGTPAALYDVTGTADSGANTLTFTSTAAELGIGVSDVIGFFGTTTNPGTTAMPDLDRNYTVSAVSGNVVTVDSVLDDGAFRTDFAKSTTSVGIIDRPVSADIATLSATNAERTRMAALGGFGVSPGSYEEFVIDENPDILIIDHMYNDAEANILGIGSNTSTKRSEYLGALNHVINAARAQNPYVQIILMTNFSPYRTGAPTFETFIQSQRDALLAFGKSRNIPVIDIMFEMGVDYEVNWNDAQSGLATDTGLVPDGVHPGAQLHKRIFKKVLPYVLAMAE